MIKSIIFAALAVQNGLYFWCGVPEAYGLDQTHRFAAVASFKANLIAKVAVYDTNGNIVGWWYYYDDGTKVWHPFGE